MFVDVKVHIQRFGSFGANTYAFASRIRLYILVPSVEIVFRDLNSVVVCFKPDRKVDGLPQIFQPKYVLCSHFSGQMHHMEKLQLLFCYGNSPNLKHEWWCWPHLALRLISWRLLVVPRRTISWKHRKGYDRTFWIVYGNIRSLCSWSKPQWVHHCYIEHELLNLPPMTDVLWLSNLSSICGQ